MLVIRNIKLTYIRGVSKFAIPVREVTSVAHLAIAIVVKVATALGLIFRIYISHLHVGPVLLRLLHLLLT